MLISSSFLSLERSELIWIVPCLKVKFQILGHWYLIDFLPYAMVLKGGKYKRFLFALFKAKLVVWMSAVNWNKSLKSSGKQFWWKSNTSCSCWVLITSRTLSSYSSWKIVLVGALNGAKVIILTHFFWRRSIRAIFLLRDVRHHKLHPLIRWEKNIA